MLSYRIQRAGDLTPEPAALGLPGELHPDCAAGLDALHTEFDARARDLGAQLAADPPRWAMAALGPVPTLDDSPDAPPGPDQR